MPVAECEQHDRGRNNTPRDEGKIQTAPDDDDHCGQPEDPQHRDRLCRREQIAPVQESANADRQSDRQHTGNSEDHARLLDVGQGTLRPGSVTGGRTHAQSRERQGRTTTWEAFGVVNISVLSPVRRTWLPSYRSLSKYLSMVYIA